MVFYTPPTAAFFVDEFDSPQAGLGRDFTLVIAIVLICVFAAVSAAALVRRIVKQRALTGWCLLCFTVSSGALITLIIHLYECIIVIDYITMMIIKDLMLSYVFLQIHHYLEVSQLED